MWGRAHFRLGCGVGTPLLLTRLGDAAGSGAHPLLALRTRGGGTAWEAGLGAGQVACPLLARRALTDGGSGVCGLVSRWV